MPEPPRATYRLQLHPAFTLDDAAGLVDYLAELGVSHVYTSPILGSAAGSTHGYDVVDPTTIEEELGGSAAYERFSDRLRSFALGHLLDLVPNHMATDSQNPWWRDVLARGEQSPYARFFDVDWRPGDAELEGRVLVPVLERPLAEAVEEGEVKLAEDPERPGELVVECAGQRLPLEMGEEEARSLAGELAAGGSDPRRLLELLDRQPYLLTPWRRTRSRLNYRRFFTLASMVGLRVEDPVVFEAAHRTVLELVREGRLQGLRIDHVDGLRDPQGYLERLERAGAPWTLVEKILAPGESLPPHWRAAGTTGYDFAAAVGGLFVDPTGEAAHAALYAEFTGEEVRFSEVAYRAKLEVARGELAPEVEVLAELLEEVAALRAGDDPPSPFFLHQALVELLACFPVYRAYARPGPGELDDHDAAAICRAWCAARERRPELAPALVLLSSALLLEPSEASGPAAELVWRFQQTSGPVMAKAVEDRAFYRHNRFVALNEVGTDPDAFGASPDDFHRFCLERQERAPAGLNALSTHDSKRSADLRCRLYVLSEMPAEWGAAVRRWAEHNQRLRRGDWPDRNLEYLLYQTLAGAHPLPFERAWPYLRKAAREASVHTSWTRPDTEYEEALEVFLRAIYEDRELMAEIGDFSSRLQAPGRTSSLAATLLALTAPGVPDLYQGGELWDLSLVDPDNRRPVDFARRRQALAALAAEPPPEEVLARGDDGWPKLWVIRQALELRRRRPRLFSADGAYHPLWARGPRRRHLLAYLRQEAGCGGESDPGAVVCVPRLVHSLAGHWQDTGLDLPRGRWRNRLTGETVGDGRVEVRHLLARFPVALLERGDAVGGDRRVEP